MINSASFPPARPLPLPSGQSEQSIKAFFGSIEMEGAPKGEMTNYWNEDWRRFVYTFGLAAGLKGECLELGSNPHYTTFLLKEFTELNLTLANYFGDHFASQATQPIAWNSPHTGAANSAILSFFHFNIEKETFPFSDGQFDLVLLCEIIEHLQNDPVQVLREIKRVLRPGGRLILTTPNVSRLENVARLIAGANIYDPYSGYGPYGRHNREYNRHELSLLLDYCGFDIEIFFSADVHENRASDHVPISVLQPLVSPRLEDLGQYLFVRARNTRPARGKRPSWLYRSYPTGHLEP